MGVFFFGKNQNGTSCYPAGGSQKETWHAGMNVKGGRNRPVALAGLEETLTGGYGPHGYVLCALSSALPPRMATFSGTSATLESTLLCRFSGVPQAAFRPQRASEGQCVVGGAGK